MNAGEWLIIVLFGIDCKQLFDVVFLHIRMIKVKVTVFSIISELKKEFPTI